MCCCGKPTVNNEMGYRWQPNDAPTVRGVNPPDLQDGDVLLFDEPGRCGGLDSHSLHCRLVRDGKSNTFYSLLVRHGGGDERFRITSTKAFADGLAALDSNSRYWILSAMHSAHRDGADEAQEKESHRWRKAAADKRIKTRKFPARGVVKVWIEDAIA